MATREIEVNDLVEAIEQRIRTLNIPDVEAARQLDISPQRLSQWKRGARMNLDGNLQRLISRFLDVAPSRVLALYGFQVGPEAPLASGPSGGYGGIARLEDYTRPVAA